MTITLTLTLTLTVAAQAQRQLKVYMKGGLTDKVQVDGDASIGHSRTDLNGRVHDDFVSIVVTDNGGRERQYLISQIDSLVMPNGRRVVFVGNVNGNGNQNDNENQNENEKDSRSPQRRTSFDGEFPGTVGKNVKFYWTENDRIRLDVGNVSRARLTGDGSSAAFVFDDAELDASQYTVYYPDKTVTIATQQTQTGVDNTQHIGRSGDCGIGTARRNGNVNGNENSPTPDTYHFALDHQVAYLCFLPRIDYLPSVRVTQIDVECSEAIAGTYQLAPGGLLNATNTSKKISLTLNSMSPSGDFFIGHTTDEAQQLTASYMVIAPQSGSRSFTVTYHLVDTLSRFTTTHQQSFSLKPVANTVYPVTCHIPESLFRTIHLGYNYYWSSVNLGSELPNEVGDYYTYQATHEAMPNTWEMPTEDAKSELQKCTWTWGTYNGTDGWLVEGTNHGNEDVGKPRIFIPLTGYRDGSNTLDTGKGYYWMDAGLGDDAGAQMAVVVSHDGNTITSLPATLAMNTRPVKAITHEFRIPQSGTNEVDLRTYGAGYDIKVYDHGGSEYNYGNSINGSLKITCAEGYKLNVTGSVNTEGCDPIVVYEVTDNGNIEIGRRSGNNTTINLTTKGNVMLLTFSSDGSVVYSGLDLTVTIQKTTLLYDVTIPDVEGGTLTADLSNANPEDTITLTATPAPGYVLEHIRVATDGKVLTLYEDDPKLFQNPASASRHYVMCDSVRVRDGNWYHDVSHFLMPYSDVVITPYFVKADSTLEVVMAGNDTTFIEQKFMQRLIDNGMTKFRFYDYAGKNGNYMDNNVNGYMLVHAPAGYKLNVAGQTWTEGNCDPLDIRDGYTNDYQLLAKVGGNSYFDTTTNNNVAFFHFHTDGSVVNKAGYAATVTMLPDTRTQYDIPANSVLELTEEHMAYLLAQGVTSMTVYSATGSEGYTHNLNGSLRFRMPEGYQIRVSGVVGTESGCDYLKVYDAEVEKIYLSGSTQSFSYTCESRNMRLYFHSDGSALGDNKMALTVEFIPRTSPGE